MKRKDLEPITRPVETHFGVYDKSEADSVMDAMENRIKELEKKTIRHNSK